MSRSPFSKALGSTLIVVALVHTASLLAAELTKSTHDMTVYLGVIPAESLKDRHEAGMHSVPSGKNQYHVTVALFERGSGQRIKNAEVTAKVGEIGLRPVEKKLEPMVIDQTITWGNFFQMASPGLYRIELKIRRRGFPTADVSFDYSKPRR